MPTPSSVLSPTTTGAHHGHTTPLDLTTATTNEPSSAAPSSVQLRQFDRPSHVIHSTRPAMPQYGLHAITLATSAYAHTIPIVVEYACPEPLLCNNYLTDRGFTWVASDESDDTYQYVVYLQSQGYTTALHPAASLAAFAAGHLAVQEHDIVVGSSEHVLRTGANLLTVTAAEHYVAV